MVIAPGYKQLLIPGVDFGAEGFFMPEIKGCILHRQELPCRETAFSVFTEALRKQLQPVPQDAALPVQIEVAVIGEVHQSVRIGIRIIFNPEGILLRKGKADPDLQSPRIAFLSIGRGSPAQQTLSLGGHPPHFSVKALSAAMEMVFPVIPRQLVPDAVQGEFRSRNTVSDPADGGAQVFAVQDVFLRAVIAQHHIYGSSLPVRDAEALYRCTIIQNCQRRAAVVGNRRGRDGSPVLQFSKVRKKYRHFSFSFRFSFLRLSPGRGFAPTRELQYPDSYPQCPSPNRPSE